VSSRVVRAHFVHPAFANRWTTRDYACERSRGFLRHRTSRNAGVAQNAVRLGSTRRFFPSNGAPASDDDGCTRGDFDTGIAPHFDALVASCAGWTEVNQHHTVVLPIEDIP